MRHDLSIRRLLSAVVGRGIHDRAVWGGSSRSRAGLREAIRDPLPRLVLEHVATSAVDGFQKLLFRTADGLAVETVLIPLHKPGAVSVCLSSQVGCAMGCVFCATARMPRRRNLETWEMVDQLVQARELVVAQGRRVTGAVFMGMGEPFLNYDRVMAAADLLCCPYGGAIGCPGDHDQHGGARPRDRPLHGREAAVPAVDQPGGRDRREAGAPGARRRRGRRSPRSWPPPAAMPCDRRERVMLAYVCISGVNVSEDDARALGDLIGDTPVRLDLIDVTDPTGRFHPPGDENAGPSATP